MSNDIFKFKSITYAIKAKDIAEQMRYKTKLTKNPNPGKGEGCGYSLTVYGSDGKLREAFDRRKIKYIGQDVV